MLQRISKENPCWIAGQFVISFCITLTSFSIWAGVIYSPSFYVAYFIPYRYLLSLFFVPLFL